MGEILEAKGFVFDEATLTWFWLAELATADDVRELFGGEICDGDEQKPPRPIE